MFGDEPYGNYNRILLSSVLAGSHEPRDIFLNPLQWYEDNGITLHAGVRVETVDRSKKTVYAADGVQERYHRLVFATGAKPFIPPIQELRSETGRFRDGIFLFRTLDDSLQIMKHARTARKAVVIGGGLLGLEAARGLLNRGLEVHVAELMPHPMAVQLDPLAGGRRNRTPFGILSGSMAGRHGSGASAAIRRIARTGRSRRAQMIAAIELGRLVVNLGRAAKIPRGEGRVFQIGRSSIAVFHTRNGGVFATEPSCPHKSGPLADGIIGEHKVICPLHAFVFDLSNGQAVGNNCRALKTYPAVVNEEGEILVGIEEVLAAR